jgi:hypothetical protein
VGQGGANQDHDVRVVQFLLNRAIPRIYPDRAGLQVDQESQLGSIAVTALPINGRISPETITVIKDFQRLIVRLPHPDGRIDPGKRSIQELLANFQQEGGAVPLSLKEAYLAATPRSPRVQVAGPFFLSGNVGPGDVFSGLDGRRLVVSASATMVIFQLLDASGPGDDFRDLNPLRSEVGHYYRQNLATFVDEFTTIFFREHGDRMLERVAPLVLLLEVEVHFALGLVAGAGGILVYGVVTLGSIFFFLLENRRQFPHWVAIVQALLEARDDLRRLAPTLYDKLFDALFLNAVRNVPRNLLSNSSLHASFGVGVIVGAIGRTAFKSKLSVFLFCLTVLGQIIRTILLSTPGAVQQALIEADLTRMVNSLTAQGMQITPRERDAIQREVKANPQAIMQIIDRLSRAVNEHAAGLQ